MDRTFSTKNLVVVGSLIMLVTVGGFLTWSMTMSLSAASVAHGNLVVESKRKQIQHIQGGWVKEVFVKDGQKVKVGQLLVELSDVKSESEYKRYQYRNYSLLAQQARLNSLINSKRELDVPEVFHTKNVEVMTITPIIESEKIHFQQGILRFQLMNSLYEQKLSLFQEKIQGSQFQKRAITSQRGLVKQEIDMTKGLVAKGYVSKTRMLELQRHHARIEAELAEINLTIEVAKRELQSVHEAFKNQTLELQREYALQLKAVEDEIRDVGQILKTLEDVRSRIQIRSEFNGHVVGLNISSVGGVVKPGQVLMEIVPDSDDLIVEALVPPKDIDIVRSGQSARVRLTAYSVREVPPVTGEVMNVSADRIYNNKGTAKETQGYLVKIRLDKKALEHLRSEQGVELYPGMLTEVLILVEQRTVWDYLVNPLMSGLNRSMREI